MTNPGNQLSRCKQQQPLIRWLLLIIPLILIGGCKQGVIQPGYNLQSSSLDDWLKNEASPALQQQLQNQPRFNNQRLKISKLAGDQPQETSDQLTQQLRLRLQQTVVASNKVRLVSSSGGTATSSSRLDCHQHQQFDYLLGIAIDRIQGDRYRVRLRLMDIVDRSWVNGVDLQWQGSLDKRQQLALNTAIPDERMRGLRTLPFLPSQTDMLAQHLAHELSCQMLRNRDQSAKVYLPSQHQDPFIQQIYSQLPSYLAQLQEARPVAKKQQAELLLGAKLEVIDGQLHQLWLNATEHSGELVTGVNAEAYVHIAPLAQRLSPPPQAPEEEVKKPQIAQRITVEPILENPSQSPTLPTVETGLFSRLLVPAHPKLCRSNNPWRRGEQSQRGSGNFSAPGCFALELQVPKGYQTYLFAQQNDGGLVRLAPDSCQGLVRFSHSRGSNDTLRFPSKRGHGSNALRLTGSSQTYYAVALPKGRQSRELRQHLTRLPGQCNSRRGYAGQRIYTGKWLARLQRLVDKQPDIIWQAKTVYRSSRDQRLYSRFDKERRANY